MQPSPVSTREMEGYGLTTAQIVYRLPDHREIFQEFVWQDYDLFPRFPALQHFLAFWEEKIEGPLHSITVAHAKLLMPSDWKAISRGLMH
jgi:uncharacterized protein Usg